MIPAGCHTACATGEYTSNDQGTTKRIMAENFIRSATAPVISAAVMIAKVIWNIINTVSGMVVGTSDSPPMPAPRMKGPFQLMPFSMNFVRSPIYWLPLPKAME